MTVVDADDSSPQVDLQLKLVVCYTSIKYITLSMDVLCSRINFVVDVIIVICASFAAVSSNQYNVTVVHWII